MLNCSHIANAKAIHIVRNVPKDGVRDICNHSGMEKPTTQTWYLAEWIDYKGLSIEAAAQLVGTSRGFLHQLMTGDRRWNRDHLYAISKAFDISPMQLVGQNPLQSGELYSLVAKVPPEQVSRAAQVLQAFIEPERLAS